MLICVWLVIENGADAQGRVRNRGRYPSAWLANNKAPNAQQGPACHFEATEVADNQLRDFLGGRLALLRWRTMGASHAIGRKRGSPVDSCNGTTLPNPVSCIAKAYGPLTGASSIYGSLRTWMQEEFERQSAATGPTRSRVRF
jgi:hypothetical protein